MGLTWSAPKGRREREVDDLLFVEHLRDVDSLLEGPGLLRQVGCVEVERVDVGELLE